MIRFELVAVTAFVNNLLTTLPAFFIIGFGIVKTNNYEN
jgi:hypothetical protein